MIVKMKFELSDEEFDKLLAKFDKPEKYFSFDWDEDEEDEEDEEYDFNPSSVSIHDIGIDAMPSSLWFYDSNASTSSHVNIEDVNEDYINRHKGADKK